MLKKNKGIGRKLLPKFEGMFGDMNPESLKEDMTLIIFEKRLNLELGFIQNYSTTERIDLEFIKENSKILKKNWKSLSSSGKNHIFKILEDEFVDKVL